MILYYMRDNHTFRPLPLDLEQALAVVREEFAKGYTYGMLCQSEPRSAKVAHARKDFAEFEPRAREWLTAALANQFSPGDAEYLSWVPRGVGPSHGGSDA